jgi:hypothetical protein
MTVLLQRRCAVVVGDTRINSLPSGLRVAFSVEKTDGREANKATITIANLLPTTRARMDKPGLSVVLEAGYSDLVGVIFAGTCYRTTHKQQGSDMLTTIEATDGGKAMSTKFGAWSYRPGTTIESVVRDVARGLGLPLSTGSRINPSPRAFERGWSFAGSAAAALDAVTRAASLTWSVQTGSCWSSTPSMATGRQQSSFRRRPAWSALPSESRRRTATPPPTASSACRPSSNRSFVQAGSSTFAQA